MEFTIPEKTKDGLYIETGDDNARDGWTCVKLKLTKGIPYLALMGKPCGICSATYRGKNTIYGYVECFVLWVTVTWLIPAGFLFPVLYFVLGANVFTIFIELRYQFISFRCHKGNCTSDSWMMMPFPRSQISGLILGLHQANEIHCYKVMPSHWLGANLYSALDYMI